jgi:hypothetical protein
MKRKVKVCKAIAKPMNRTLILLLLSFVLWLPASAQIHQWSKVVSGPGMDLAKEITTDKDGNVYQAGIFTGVVDFDGTVLYSNGGLDIFLAKYDPDGNILWAFSIGGPGDDIANGVGVYKDDYVYITGSYSLSVDFDPGLGTELLVSGGDDDIFVAAYDENGDFEWANGYGGIESDVAYGLDVEKSGNIVVVGSFRQTVNFDGENLTSGGEDDIFVANFDDDGDLDWVESFGSTAALSDRAFDVSADHKGKIFVVGEFQGSVDFEPGNNQEIRTSLGSTDVFLLELKKNAKLKDVTTFGSAGTERATKIDGNKNANRFAITGTFDQAINLGGGGGLTTGGDDDIFVAVFDKNQNLQWASAYGSSPDNEAPGDLALDDNGNLFLTGKFNGTIDLGGGGLTTGGDDDIFAAKLDPAGSHVWSAKYGSTGHDYAFGVCVDPDQDVLITGCFSTAVNFGGGGLTTGGDDDIFIFKEGPDSTGSLTNVRMINNATPQIERDEKISGQMQVELLTDETDFFDLYPNPTRGAIQVQIPASTGEDAQLVLTDANGRVLMRRSSLEAGSGMQLNLGPLPNGMYILKLQEGDNFIAKKLILQR